MSEHGCVLVLQIAGSAKDYETRNLTHVEIALNDRQIRSLARDLGRAAEERGIRLWSRARLLSWLRER